MAETVKIPGELESTATGNKVVDVANVKDKTQGNKTQFQINADVEEAIGADDVPGSVKGRIKENETALGEGGSVDQRIAEEGAKHYLKSETYSKPELNNMITTPNQEYVTVTATDQTTAATDVLPATGAADKVYRVGNWDGTQYDETCYSEYAWNGSAYVHLSTKTQIGEVFDISAYHATGGTLAIYDNLNDALNGPNGGVPQSLQKGGMSVKFVQTSDNKYVQYRLKSEEWNTNPENWYLYEECLVTNSSEWIKVLTDKDGVIIAGIKSDWSVDWLFGVPNPIKNYVLQSFNTLDAKILNILSIQYVDDNCDDYIYVILDNEDRILAKINPDGSFEWSIGVSEVIKDYVANKIEENNSHTEYSFPYFSENNDGCFAISATSKAGKYLGMNTMIDFPDHVNHIEDFVIKMHDMGVEVCRIIRRDFYNNTAELIAKYDTIFYYMFKYGVKIMVTEPIYDNQYSGNDVYNEELRDDVLESIRQFVARYNGTNDIYPSDNPQSIPEKVKVDFYEIKNEIKIYSYNVEDIFEVQKAFYNIVKEESPTSLVIGCGFAAIYDNEPDLYTIEDNNGKTYSDYLDIINYHIYPYKNVQNRVIDDAIGHWRCDINRTFADKECWMGEMGWSTYRFVGDQQVQANYIVEGYIMALSDGMTKILTWTFECLGNYFISAGHGSCGLVENCSSGGYGAFYKPNTKESASGFDWDVRLYINNPIQRNYFELNLNRLPVESFNYIKENGIDIGGYHYTIDSIKVNNNTIYDTDYVINEDNVLHLTYEQLGSPSNTAVITVYAKDVDNTDNFVFTPRKAYYAVKLLYDEMLDKDSSLPVIENANDIYYASWINGNSENIRCIWNQSTKDIRISFWGAFNAEFYDCLGNRIDNIDPKNFVLSVDSFYYIKNSSNNLKFKLL